MEMGALYGRQGNAKERDMDVEAELREAKAEIRRLAAEKSHLEDEVSSLRGESNAHWLEARRLREELSLREGRSAEVTGERPGG